MKKPVKPKNERTSKGVARIAGYVLEALKDADMDYHVSCVGSKGGPTVYPCTAKQLKALAASCLTQAHNKPKVRRKKVI